MMRIKEIRFIGEVKDQLNASIDIGIEFENVSSYKIIGRRNVIKKRQFY